MQFKRPLNVTKTRKDGVPCYVNSFQFLRANKLVLSVKKKELINGWEIPPAVMARCKDAPLTEQELADWKDWKQAHDKNELIDTDVARFRTAAEQVPTILREAANAVKYDLMEPLTETAIAELWEALDEYIRQIEKKGYKRPARPRGRPKAKQIIYVEDEDRWLPNFFPPDSPEYAQYEESLRQAGKKPGDLVR